MGEIYRVLKQRPAEPTRLVRPEATYPWEATYQSTADLVDQLNSTKPEPIYTRDRITEWAYAYLRPLAIEVDRILTATPSEAADSTVVERSFGEETSAELPETLPEKIIALDSEINEIAQTIDAPTFQTLSAAEQQALLDKGLAKVAEGQQLMNAQRPPETAPTTTGPAAAVHIGVLATTDLATPRATATALATLADITAGKIGAQVTIHEPTSQVRDVRPQPGIASLAEFTGHGFKEFDGKTTFTLRTTEEARALNPMFNDRTITVENFQAFVPPIDETGKFVSALERGFETVTKNGPVILSNEAMAQELNESGMTEIVFSTCFSSDLGLSILRECPQVEHVVVFNGLLPANLGNDVSKYIALAYSATRNLRLAFHSGLQLLHDHYTASIKTHQARLAQITTTLGQYKEALGGRKPTPQDYATVKPLLNEQRFLAAKTQAIQDIYLPQMKNWRLISRKH